MTPDVLAETHALAFADRRPWSATEFTDLLATTGVILCGDARSFLLGRVLADEAEVLTLATRPEFQRQGLAQNCLNRFLEMAAKQAASTAFLEVSHDNTPAKSLYYNAGFTVAGERSNYYTTPDGLKVAALVMRKALNKYTNPPLSQ